MKKLGLLILVLISTLVACGKRANQGIVTTGLNNQLATNCLATGTCGNTNFNNGIFTNYPMNNGLYQGHQNQFQHGFGGCGMGSVPVFHASIGLACIPVSYLNGMANLAYWNWDPYAFSFSFFGWYSTGFSSMGSGGVFGLCTMGTRSCGLGSCNPIGGGIWGVCGNGNYGGYGY